MTYSLYVEHDSPSSKTGVFVHRDVEIVATDDQDAIQKAEVKSTELARGWKIYDRHLSQGDRLVKRW